MSLVRTPRASDACAIHGRAQTCAFENPCVDPHHAFLMAQTVVVVADSDGAAPADAFVRVPGARAAVALLLSINLFNYIDRYVLAAVESRIATDLLPGDPNALAKVGSLATTFVISYMISAPIFGYLADRGSRWLLVGVGV